MKGVLLALALALPGAKAMGYATDGPEGLIYTSGDRGYTMVSSAEEVIANPGVWEVNTLICLNTNPYYDKSMVALQVSPPTVQEGWFAGDPQFCYAFACSTTGEILPSFQCEGSFCGAT